jgi:hypothetical protein
MACMVDTDNRPQQKRRNHTVPANEIRPLKDGRNAQPRNDMAMNESTQRLLDALMGVAYIVTVRGEILAVGERHWAEFANDSQSGDLKASALLGRNLFDYIKGDAVREYYRSLHATLISGGGRASFEYRCDAPDTERRMLMSVSSFELDSQMPLILYQSQVIDERVRVPVPFLVANNYTKSYDDNDLASICSFLLPGRMAHRARTGRTDMADP